MFRALLVFLLASQMNAEKIDWDSAVAGLMEEFLDSLNNGRVREMVQRVFAPGFTAIGPNWVIRGSFDALEKSYTDLVARGGRTQDTNPVIVSTFGKYAVEWHRAVTMDCEGKILETGLTSAVLEYIDGKAKVILSHYSPELTENK